MEMIASYYTDAGNYKKINQDALSIKVVNSPQGKIVFAIVCDGMGGLERGELASKEAVLAFNNWFVSQFQQMVAANMFLEEELYIQWEKLIQEINDRLEKYAGRKGVMMGTTLSALLVYQNHYYICHVGDSRVYRITQSITQVTKDQTLVAQKVKMGQLTQEQARVDSRRNILLQCVGACKVVEPQYETGIIDSEITFLLASDGFVHLISEEELYQIFHPEILNSRNQMTDICERTARVVMERGERDNITIIAILIK